jgi:hypothetical protein
MSLLCNSKSRSASHGGPFILYGLDQPAAAVDHRLEAGMTRIDVGSPPFRRSPTHPRASLHTDGVPSLHRRTTPTLCDVRQNRRRLRRTLRFKEVVMKPTESSPEPTPRPSIWITPRESAAHLNVGVDIISQVSAGSGVILRRENTS